MGLTGQPFAAQRRRVPRFYFDVRDGGSFTPDHEGVEFASTHDARVDASRALAEMVKGAMPDGPRTAMAIGLEGIVSKRVTSRYKSGSCLAWVKVKNPAYERP